MASLYFRAHSETKWAESSSCDQIGAARVGSLHPPTWFALAHHQLTTTTSTLWTPLPQGVREVSARQERPPFSVLHRTWQLQATSLSTKLRHYWPETYSVFCYLNVTHWKPVQYLLTQQIAVPVLSFCKNTPVNNGLIPVGEYLAFVGLLLPHAMVILKDYRLFS